MFVTGDDLVLLVPMVTGDIYTRLQEKISELASNETPELVFNVGGDETRVEYRFSSFYNYLKKWGKGRLQFEVFRARRELRD